MAEQMEFELDMDEVRATKVGIVDADSIMFNLGWFYHKSDMLPNDGADYRNATSVPPDIEKAVQTFLAKLRGNMGVDYLHLHFSGSPKNAGLFEEFMGRPPISQFRESLETDYKANRKSAPLPVGYHLTLRSLLQEPNAYIHDQWEADEAVILHKKLNPDWVLSSNDKDVYKQHHGKNWMYDKRQKWTDIDKDYANYFAFLQAITGDVTDGFIGAKGIGPAGAKKFVSPDKTPAENWQGVLDAFESKKLTEKDALVNMRFANMHQLKLDDSGAPYVDLWKPEGHHLEPVWR